MNNPELGAIIETDAEANRDAIHIAIAPVVSDEKLYPGQFIGLDSSGMAKEAKNDIKAIGIVDPFLDHIIMPGTRFWMCLFPKSITSLRHEWTHPAFDNSIEGPLTNVMQVAKSVAWLQNAAATAGVSYDKMMEAIKQDEYINMGDNQNYDSIDQEEFKKHIKIVTGKDEIYPPFTCAC